MAAYDELVWTTGEELWDRLHQAHRRFAALLSVTPHRTPLKDSTWTAGDVAAHLLCVVQRYSSGAVARGEGLSPDRGGIADLNAAGIGALADLSVAEVLDRVWQELADLEKQLPRTLDLHRRFPFHGSQEMDGAAALGNLIGEFLVHGWDVARARGKVWKIGSRNAALALTVGVQTAPAFVAPGAPDLRLLIRTPETNPWLLDLADGELVSRRAGRRERADVKVFARTEPLLLNLYGRIGVAQAAVLGTTVVGGRRPWRVARMPKTFVAP